MSVRIYPVNLSQRSGDDVHRAVASGHHLHPEAIAVRGLAGLRDRNERTEHRFGHLFRHLVRYFNRHVGPLVCDPAWDALVPLAM